MQNMNCKYFAILSQKECQNHNLLCIYSVKEIAHPIKLSRFHPKDLCLSKLVIKETQMTNSVRRDSVRTTCVPYMQTLCNWNWPQRNKGKWIRQAACARAAVRRAVLGFNLNFGPSKHVFTHWEEVGRLKGRWLEREEGEQWRSAAPRSAPWSISLAVQ